MTGLQLQCIEDAATTLERRLEWLQYRKGLVRDTIKPSRRGF